LRSIDYGPLAFMSSLEKSHRWPQVPVSA